MINTDQLKSNSKPINIFLMKIKVQYIANIFKKKMKDKDNFMDKRQ